SSLNNVGFVLHALGEYGLAESYYRDSLAMCRQLYPQARYPEGHPQLATSLNSLGALQQARGEYARAEPLFREALAMYLTLSQRLADMVAEAEALIYAASLPLTRDAYLNVTRGRSPDATVYDL